MDIDKLTNALNLELLQIYQQPLNVAEVLVLKGIYQEQTYGQIAHTQGYSAGYISNIVAPELYRKLSSLVGQTITKKNCRLALQLYLTKQPPPPTPPPEAATYHYPSGAIPLNSSFYIESPQMQARISQELSKPGSLVRIKAPQQMGKTSLLLRILEECRHYDYATVIVSLDKIDQATFADLSQFLRRLCKYIARQLRLEPQLEAYWDEELDGKMNWTLYFEDYLLTQISHPIVLALDEVNQIFEHPKLAQDFLSLLRSCYEDAQRLSAWQKLRLIVVHDTETYIPLHINQSPFNVGLPMQLEDFQLSQVQDLAHRYGLNWYHDDSAQSLMQLVGGHPALIHIAIYHFCRGDITLTQLLAETPSNPSIYFNHLHRHWLTLHQHPQLLEAFQSILDGFTATIDEMALYKLRSLGLIQDHDIKVYCELYRRYFTKK